MNEQCRFERCEKELKMKEIKLEGRQVRPSYECEKTATIEQLQDELERYKAVAFYLVRIHRVAPEGLKLHKSQQQIDDMSEVTIKHMADNLDKEILREHKRAACRMINK